MGEAGKGKSDATVMMALYNMMERKTPEEVLYLWLDAVMARLQEVKIDPELDGEVVIRKHINELVKTPVENILHGLNNLTVKKIEKSNIITQ